MAGRPSPRRTANEDPTHVNLVQIRRTRPSLKPGDVFAFSIGSDGLYRFGRVVLVDYSNGPMGVANLVYIYDGAQPTMDPPDMLTPNELLIPPAWTNRQAWLRGYFVTIDHRPLTPHDVLDQHCFAETVSGKTTYVDENRIALPRRLEPCGTWGLASHRGLDDWISEKLGIPLAPD